MLLTEEGAELKNTVPAVQLLIIWLGTHNHRHCIRELKAVRPSGPGDTHISREPSPAQGRRGAHGNATCSPSVPCPGCHRPHTVLEAPLEFPFKSKSLTYGQGNAEGGVLGATSRGSQMLTSSCLCPQLRCPMREPEPAHLQWASYNRRTELCVSFNGVKVKQPHVASGHNNRSKIKSIFILTETFTGQPCSIS